MLFYRVPFFKNYISLFSHKDIIFLVLMFPLSHVVASHLFVVALPFDLPHTQCLLSLPENFSK